ncbi:cytochrome P450 2U1-like [Diadema antillarum]|uniref:cytochrome P450 2U1-like n=1 Tax=Diadema antillarum TaxID=105358 RepID=UPI003A88BD0E
MYFATALAVTFDSWNLSDLTRLLLSFIIAVAVLREVQLCFRLPPGPWFLQLKLLIVGLPRHSSTGGRHDELFAQLSKEFGKIFSFRRGRDFVVVLNDPEIIQEAFVKKKDVFNDRRGPAMYECMYGGRNAHRLLGSHAQSWKTTRRVVGPCLKNVGSWGRRMESIISLEADQLIDELASFGPISCDPRNKITQSVANIIYALAYGHRLEYEDPKLLEIIDAIDTIMGHSLSTALTDRIRYLPFLYLLPSTRPMRNAYEVMKRTMTKAVEKRLDATASDGEGSTIIERIIASSEEEKEGASLPERRQIPTEDIWRVLYDVMLAGTDTTSNTLCWAVLIMAHHQQVQKQVQEEIDLILAGRKPSLQDQKSMPFTRATIMEVLRLRPVGPLAVPHSASETAVLRDYTIPKGSILLGNVMFCHHDPDHWHDPELFDPHRFLSGDRTKVIRDPPAFLPFGVGPRMCIGEQLAKNELFIVFTRIMQRFRVDFTPGDRPDVLDKGWIAGQILRPNRMKVRIIKRDVTPEKTD